MSEPRETVTSDESLYEILLADVEAGALAAQQRTFTKGEIVFHEGDLGDTIHLVLDGMFGVRIATPTGDAPLLDILEQGDVFGEFAVFSATGRRTSDITAITAGETLEVRREQLRALLHSRPELCEQLVATIVDKADRTSHRLVDLLHVPAELRVLRALLELAGGEDDTEISLTQQDLASFAGTTRPTANHVLRQEVERGSVAVARGRITVLDARRLVRRAGADSRVS